MLPGLVRGMGAWCKCTMELQQYAREPGKDGGRFHTTQSGHPITTQAATNDGFPTVACSYLLGRRLNCSVPVKHGGTNRFAKVFHTFTQKEFNQSINQVLFKKKLKKILVSFVTTNNCSINKNFTLITVTRVTVSCE